MKAIKKWLEYCVIGGGGSGGGVVPGSALDPDEEILVVCSAFLLIGTQLHLETFLNFSNNVLKMSV
jgi:hypothetical protein